MSSNMRNAVSRDLCWKVGRGSMPTTVYARRIQWKQAGRWRRGLATGLEVGIRAQSLAFPHVMLVDWAEGSRGHGG